MVRGRHVAAVNDQGTEPSARCLACMWTRALTAATVAVACVRLAHGENRVEHQAAHEAKAPTITIAEPVGATLERTHVVVASATVM